VAGSDLLGYTQRKHSSLNERANSIQNAMSIQNAILQTAILQHAIFLIAFKMQ
jgi:hypothetical protein